MVAPLSFTRAWSIAFRSSALAHLLGLYWLSRRPQAGPNGTFFQRNVLPIMIAVAVAAVPLAINAVVHSIDPALAIDTDTKDFPLSFALAALTAALCYCASTGLRFVNDRRSELKFTLHDPELQKRLRRLVLGYFSWVTQTVFVIVIVGAVAWSMAAWALTTDRTFSVPGWIAPLWLAGVGALCLHWCVPLPLVLDLLLRPAARPTVVKHDPASTPWIKILARVAGLGGALIVTMAFLIAMLLLWMFVFSPAVPTVSIIALAQSMLVWLAVCLLVIAAWFSLIPMWQLTTVVTTAKRIRLSELDDEITALAASPVGRWRGGRRAQLLAEYQQVSQSPDTPFAAAGLIQYTAAITGTAIALAVPALVDALSPAGG